jgi:hypothetical protein
VRVGQSKAICPTAGLLQDCPVGASADGTLLRGPQ